MDKCLLVTIEILDFKNLCLKQWIQAEEQISFILSFRGFGGYLNKIITGIICKVWENVECQKKE